ncbi:Cinnamyl alcohol dehydrogenase [Arachis hypogaea]|nr:Cinnamyl alcohol dehydrogenase [Arachis hypogaea]
MRCLKDAAEPPLNKMHPHENSSLFVKSQLVKHVILTSLIAAVTFNGRLLTPKAVVDDTWFFDHELCKESKEKKPYSNKVAKLKAEYEKAMESYNAAEAGGEKGEGEGEHEEG